MAASAHGAGRAGVVFDLDGTLVDTNYLHALAWARAFAEAGEWAPTNAIHRLIGMGGDQLVPEVLGHDCPAAVAARPRHVRALLEDARPFPGAAGLVRRVHDAGLVAVIATSSPRGQLEGLLALLDLGDALDGSTSAEEVAASKPDPAVFVEAMRRYDIDPRRAVAVGDSVWDVRAARAAGIGCVCVESGGFSQHELSEAGALHVYRDVAELCDQFALSPLGLLAAAGAPDAR